MGELQSVSGGPAVRYQILILAKYGGYAAALWVTISHWGFEATGPLLALLAVIGVDSIRSFYVESRYPNGIVAWLWFQWICIGLYLWLDASGIASIPYIILIAESEMAFRGVGLRIFLASTVTFLAVGTGAAYQQDTVTMERLSTVLINSLFFFFAFGVSYLARVQQEERERAEAALSDLQRSQMELQEAHQRLMERSREGEAVAVMKERQRIARDIHDTLAHSLTGIIVGLEACKRLLGRDTERTEHELTRIQEQARTGLDEIRRSVKDFKPLELEVGGFEPALRGLGREMAERGIIFDWNLASPSVPVTLEVPFYRIIQEGITNSLRHGKAGRVSIRLQDDDHRWRLEIVDDGIGVASLREGYGLRGMRERMQEVGGEIHFGAVKPHGFRIVAEVELADDPTNSHRG